MSAPGALDSDSNQSLNSLIIQNLLTPTRIGKLLKYLPMIYDETIAFISSLLFVTTPYIVKFSRVVMSEIFSLSFIILTIYLFFKYYKSDKNRYAFTLSVILIMSICARYTSIFMIPIFLCYLILQKDLKKLINKNMIIAYISIIVLLLP